MKDIYFRKLVKSPKTHKEGYLYFNLKKKVIAKTFTRSNIGASNKIDNNYYVTVLNDMYLNFYKQILRYYKNDGKLDKAIAMQYEEHDIEVNIIENLKNKQLQLNISSSTLKSPGYKIAHNIPNLTYNDMTDICNEYCLEFNFDKNEISPRHISNYENVIDIQSIVDIFEYLDEKDRNEIFPKQIPLNISKSKKEKKQYKRKISDSLNNEESFKKIYYKTRNPNLQRKFREKLILESNKLNGTTYCAICDKAYPSSFLIASHIIPVRKIEHNSKLTNDDIFSENNGLLLCPNHDLLIDKEIISFDDNFNIVVGDIDSETLKLFGLTSSYRLHKKYRNNVRKNNFKYHKNDMVISMFIKS